MTIGTVKAFWADKRYGFIRPDGGARRDVFVHQSALGRDLPLLTTGQRVEFDIAQGEKGPMASNVIAYIDPYGDAESSS